VGLCAKVRNTKAKDWALSTIASKDTQLRKYFKFCDEFSGFITPIPCSADQVCLYIAWLMGSLKYNSICQYISALNSFLQRNGEKSINYEDYELKRMFKGARRELGSSVKQAEPLLPEHLLLIVNLLSDSPGHVAFKAALILAFRALLRKDQVTDTPNTLNRGDFQFFEWGMVLTIRRSKTIQFRERTVQIPVSRLARHELCAVHWVRLHFKQLPASLDEPAFRLPLGLGSTPLTYKIYMDSIRYYSGLVGLDPSCFSTHSLRRGGATFLLMTGISVKEIMLIGDWSSNTVFKYFDLPLSHRVCQDQRVADILSKMIDDLSL